MFRTPSLPTPFHTLQVIQFLHTRTMPRRARSPGPETTEDFRNVKRIRLEGDQYKPIKIATMEAAAVVDANPPYFELKQLIEHGMPDPDKGKVVFYWMRFADLRSTSCRALLLNLSVVT